MQKQNIAPNNGGKEILRTSLLNCAIPELQQKYVSLVKKSCALSDKMNEMKKENDWYKQKTVAIESYEELKLQYQMLDEKFNDFVCTSQIRYQNLCKEKDDIIAAKEDEINALQIEQDLFSSELPKNSGKPTSQGKGKNNLINDNNKLREEVINAKELIIKLELDCEQLKLEKTCPMCKCTLIDSESEIIPIQVDLNEQKDDSDVDSDILEEYLYEMCLVDPLSPMPVDPLCYSDMETQTIIQDFKCVSTQIYKLLIDNSVQTTILVKDNSTQVMGKHSVNAEIQTGLYFTTREIGSQTVKKHVCTSAVQTNFHNGKVPSDNAKNMVTNTFTGEYWLPKAMHSKQVSVSLCNCFNNGGAAKNVDKIVNSVGIQTDFENDKNVNRTFNINRRDKSVDEPRYDTAENDEKFTNQLSSCIKDEDYSYVPNNSMIRCKERYDCSDVISPPWSCNEFPIKSKLPVFNKELLLQRDIKKLHKRSLFLNKTKRVLKCHYKAKFKKQLETIFGSLLSASFQHNCKAKRRVPSMKIDVSSKSNRDLNNHLSCKTGSVKKVENWIKSINPQLVKRKTAIIQPISINVTNGCDQNNINKTNAVAVIPPRQHRRNMRAFSSLSKQKVVCCRSIFGSDLESLEKDNYSISQKSSISAYLSDENNSDTKSEGSSGSSNNKSSLLGEYVTKNSFVEALSTENICINRKRKHIKKYDIRIPYKICNKTVTDKESSLEKDSEDANICIEKPAAVYGLSKNLELNISKVECSAIETSSSNNMGKKCDERLVVHTICKTPNAEIAKQELCNKNNATDTQNNFVNPCTKGKRRIAHNITSQNYLKTNKTEKQSSGLNWSIEKQRSGTQSKVYVERQSCKKTITNSIINSEDCTNGHSSSISYSLLPSQNVTKIDVGITLPDDECTIEELDCLNEVLKSYEFEEDILNTPTLEVNKPILSTQILEDVFDKNISVSPTDAIEASGAQEQSNVLFLKNGFDILEQNCLVFEQLHSQYQRGERIISKPKSNNKNITKNLLEMIPNTVPIHEVDETDKPAENVCVLSNNNLNDCFSIVEPSDILTNKISIGKANADNYIQYKSNHSSNKIIAHTAKWQDETLHVSSTQDKPLNNLVNDDYLDVPASPPPIECDLLVEPRTIPLEPEYERLPQENPTVLHTTLPAGLNGLTSCGKRMTLTKGAAENHLKTLLSFEASYNIELEIAQKFLNADSDIISSAILACLLKCIHSNVEPRKMKRMYTSNAQKKLLGFLFTLKELRGEATFMSFILNELELNIMQSTSITLIVSLTQFYVAYCMWYSNIFRVRLFIVKALYKMDSHVLPMLYTLVANWMAVFNEYKTDSADAVFIRGLVQAIRTKSSSDATISSYNVIKLLHQCLKYPIENEKTESLLMELFCEYFDKPDVLKKYVIIIICQKLKIQTICTTLEEAIVKKHSVLLLNGIQNVIVCIEFILEEFKICSGITNNLEELCKQFKLLVQQAVGVNN